MELVKKVLILVIIIASFFIIYNLLSQNEIIKKEIQKQINSQNKEGFETNIQELRELREKAIALADVIADEHYVAYPGTPLENCPHTRCQGAYVIKVAIDGE